MWAQSAVALIASLATGSPVFCSLAAIEVASPLKAWPTLVQPDGTPAFHSIVTRSPALRLGGGGGVRFAATVGVAVFAVAFLLLKCFRQVHSGASPIPGSEKRSLAWGGYDICGDEGGAGGNVGNSDQSSGPVTHQLRLLEISGRDAACLTHEELKQISDTKMRLKMALNRRHLYYCQVDRLTREALEARRMLAQATLMAPRDLAAAKAAANQKELELIQKKKELALQESVVSGMGWIVWQEQEALLLMAEAFATGKRITVSAAAALAACRRIMSPFKLMPPVGAERPRRSISALVDALCRDGEHYQKALTTIPGPSLGAIAAARSFVDTALKIAYQLRVADMLEAEERIGRQAMLLRRLLSSHLAAPASGTPMRGMSVRSSDSSGVRQRGPAAPRGRHVPLSSRSSAVISTPSTHGKHSLQHRHSAIEQRHSSRRSVFPAAQEDAPASTEESPPPPTSLDARTPSDEPAPSTPEKPAALPQISATEQPVLPPQHPLAETQEEEAAPQDAPASQVTSPDAMPPLQEPGTTKPTTEAESEKPFGPSDAESPPDPVDSAQIRSLSSGLLRWRARAEEILSDSDEIQEKLLAEGIALLSEALDAGLHPSVSDEEKAFSDEVERCTTVGSLLQELLLPRWLELVAEAQAEVIRARTALEEAGRPESPEDPQKGAKHFLGLMVQSRASIDAAKRCAKQLAGFFSTRMPLTPLSEGIEGLLDVADEAQQGLVDAANKLAGAWVTSLQNLRFEVENAASDPSGPSETSEGGRDSLLAVAEQAEQALQMLRELCRRTLGIQRLQETLNTIRAIHGPKPVRGRRSQLWRSVRDFSRGSSSSSSKGSKRSGRDGEK